MVSTKADRDSVGAVLDALDGLKLDALSPGIARMWRNLAADLRDVQAEASPALVAA